MKEEKIKVLALIPMGLPKEIELDNTLEAMQKFVGGLIECITLNDTGSEIALVCNDEGKLLGLPLNRCLHLEDSGAIYDVIAGTFFLCAAPPDSEHFESLTEEQLARYTERFRTPEFFVPKGAEG